MHDGSLKTLEEVVEHYDKGGTPNPSLDKDMKKLKLTAQEKADLVAFMKALTGEHKSLDELLPTLPPGPDGKAPDPALRSEPPAKKALKPSTRRMAELRPSTSRRLADPSSEPGGDRPLPGSSSARRLRQDATMIE